MRTTRNWIYGFDKNGKAKAMRWTRRRQHKQLVINQKLRKKETKEFHKWTSNNRNRIGPHSRWRTAMKADLMEHPEISTIFKGSDK